MTKSNEALIVTIGNFQFAVVNDHYADFWHSVERGEWEPETLCSLSTVLSPQWQYYDIGTWMGPTALFGATLGAKTYCFEPDPVAFARLAANVALNPSLKHDMTLTNAAVGTAAGKLTLYADALGNSETSIFSRRDRVGGTIVASTQIQVEMIDFLSFYRGNNDSGMPQLFKIDIEGAEFEFLPYIAADILKNPRTAILLSTHSFNIADRSSRRQAKENVLRPFADLRWYRYHEGRVVPADGASEIANALNHADAAGEHFVANFDILGR